MKRRDIVKLGSLWCAGLPASALLQKPFWSGHSLRDAHIVIIGGGTGGCAAALAAARAGYRVILTEETDWIGGQLTQQAVPPDEHPWIEQFGATRSYRMYREGIRSYYRDWYPLRPRFDDGRLNPGACTVSYLCHEPRAALSVLNNMLAPYVSDGRLQVMLNVYPVDADMEGDSIRAIRLRHQLSGEEFELTGAYFLDATETGDLLPLTKTEYVTGAESQAQTEEPHAPSEPAPANMQAVTWCFAIDYKDGEDHTIERPARYDYWRDYVPSLTPAWPGKLLSLTYSNPVTLEPRTLDFDPRPGAQTERFNLWSYRRLIAPHQFADGALGSDISLINWPQNDYLDGNLFEASPEEIERHMSAAREVSFSLLYWLQTEAPRPDGGMGWPGLRLRGDVCGTQHGLAKRAYIRESRRIKALFTVKEQHIGLEARMAITGLSRDKVTAASFSDSVGIGTYRIDLHPSTGGDNYIDISSLPFEIPLGALIPERVDNLLAACKNLGVTHITNGCYRLHPVEWNIGESAALTAVECLATSTSPASIYHNPDRLEALQRSLVHHGVELRWPDPLRSPR